MLPLLAMVAGFLNSFLILLFYSIGCWKNQMVLRSQLHFLRELPAPLTVQMPTFRSNRIWLIRENIPFELASQEPLKPWLKLNRTDTKVALPADWETRVDPGTARLWRKRNLLGEP